MSQALWSDVDRYLADLLPEDPVLAAVLAASAAAGLPSISVSPVEGALLSLLARLRQARAILEIGTLGGYSTICLARGLAPGGRLTTLEANPTHAAVARANLARAGLADTVDVRLGPALDTLTALAREHAVFDLVFIDADKPGYPDYWRQVLELSRPGTLIVADNVVRDGAVADPHSPDVNVQGVRRYLALAAAEPRATTTVLQTVGAKGYDGMSLSLVVAPGPVHD